MSTLRIETPRVFLPLLEPSRYKGAYGGRGSGKSHFFAGYGVERCYAELGLRWLCVREVQKSLKQSAKQLIEDKIRTYGLPGFVIKNDEIATPGGGVITFTGMQDHNADSVKSFEGYDIAWVEEAQSLSATSWRLLRPTIRKAGSEIWASWNPRRKSDPVDKFMRSHPDGSVVIKANWSDNPFFPQELLKERELDLSLSPEHYRHVWEGDYATVVEGAYYAKDLLAAEQQGRICNVGIDPLMQLYTFWDIGINDSTSIWVAQFIGDEIRVVDYYEAQGQPLGAHLNWLRSNGYEQALCVLPHDGGHRDHLTADKFEDHIQAAGFRTDTVANQGKGAAVKRIEAARRIFSRVKFDQAKTEVGREALGAYHERIDEKREVGLGPEHDWASHAADAFGLIGTFAERAKPVRQNGKSKVRRLA